MASVNLSLLKNRSPAKIKNLPLGEETFDSIIGDRKRKKTIDNYNIHKTEDYGNFTYFFRYFDPIAPR